MLNEAKDLSCLDPGVFLAPFLEIIRSEETTGPVTSLALSAVNKMISYGLIGTYPLFYSLYIINIFKNIYIKIINNFYRFRSSSGSPMRRSYCWCCYACKICWDWCIWRWSCFNENSSSFKSSYVGTSWWLSFKRKYLWNYAQLF